MAWGRLQANRPASNRCPIQPIQAGSLAAAISQESNEAPDRAGGVLSMELQAPTREDLPINALARLDTEMGQEFLTQRHLDLASNGEGSAKGG